MLVRIIPDNRKDDIAKATRERKVDVSADPYLGFPQQGQVITSKPPITHNIQITTKSGFTKTITSTGNSKLAKMMESSELFGIWCHKTGHALYWANLLAKYNVKYHKPLSSFGRRSPRVARSTEQILAEDGPVQE